MADRAERLFVTMSLFGLVREPGDQAIRSAAETGLLTEEQWAAWRETDDEDAQLALACLEAEFELRDSQWRALMLLDLALRGPEAGPAQTQTGQGACATVEVPRTDLIRLAEVFLGWHLPAPRAEEQ